MPTCRSSTRAEEAKPKRPSYDEEDDEGAELITRPPVVTVMGHVDHGKTAILDAIRKTDVAAGRGRRHHAAHRCLPGPRPTAARSPSSTRPGHEAFTAMRARGAQATDIAILVVAADDGVMPQTIEAMDHAKAAGVPIVVAVNKIDKPEADPTRVRQQLCGSGSSARGVGRRHDLRRRVGEAEDEPRRSARDDHADRRRAARPEAERQVLSRAASVIEAHLDKGRGPVATLLVEARHGLHR